MEWLEAGVVLAKQVLSQLSYTPTVGVAFILKHFPRFQNPFPRIFMTTVPELCQNPVFWGLAAPGQETFHWPNG
jgi:hypothetical protein